MKGFETQAGRSKDPENERERCRGNGSASNHEGGVFTAITRAIRPLNSSGIKVIWLDVKVV
jgi:hypothetical protein